MGLGSLGGWDGNISGVLSWTTCDKAASKHVVFAFSAPAAHVCVGESDFLAMPHIHKFNKKNKKQAKRSRHFYCISINTLKQAGGGISPRQNRAAGRRR